MGFKVSPDAVEIAFIKMHGAGNDYIYLPLLSLDKSDFRLPDDIAILARRISDRHFGIGGDGLVIVTHSDNADFGMRMFNADGSEAGMCGNATRCIGKLVYDFGYTDKTEISLETISGIKHLILHPGHDGNIESVTVDMGIPRLNAEDIPANREKGHPIIDFPVDAGEYNLGVTAVNIGNPHGVVFVNTLSDALVHRRGPILENADIWPERANIEFVKVESPRHIVVRVWERGTGETLACGTGACAAVVAGVIRGLTDRKVDVKMTGGTLHIDYDEKSGHVFMTGPASTVATGTYYFDTANGSDLFESRDVIDIHNDNNHNTESL